MTRVSKQQERRNRCPRKHKAPSLKTGPKPEVRPFNPKVNALEGAIAQMAFIPKIS